MTMNEVTQQIKSAHKEVTSNLIPGGQADNVPSTQFDPEALAKGIKHEMEHTTSPAVAEEIAKDHLAEDPEYYEKLDKLKLRGVDVATFRLATEKEPMTIQTIIFDKEQFDAAKAKEWLASNDFNNPGADETTDSLRYRQREPNEFQEDTFRTVEIAEGIKAVMGKLI